MNALLAEVSQIGHEIRSLVRCQPVLIERACGLHIAFCLPLLQVAPLDDQLVQLDLQLCRPVVVLQVLLQTGQQGLDLIQGKCRLRRA
ncbi:hypothetical protein D3C85_1330690 [compost metagenome]